MLRVIKYIAIGFAVLIALLLIAIAIISATFDPNTYKPTIIKLIQEKKQRTLSIPGEIKLTFFPKLGADLGKISISEHQNSDTFASMESAKLSVALLPLLSKQLVVDHIKVDGLVANIKRYKDGKTNFDDLLSKDDKEESPAFKFDIDGISVTNATISLDDQMAGRKLALSKLNLDTGKIANGVTSKFDLKTDVKVDKPSFAAQVNAKSGFNIDLDKKHYVLNKMDVEVKGNAAGITNMVLKLAGDADLKPVDKQINLLDIKFSMEGDQGATKINSEFSVPKLVISDQQITADKISGDAKIKDAVRQLEAKLGIPSFNGSPKAFKIPSLEINAEIKQGDLNAKAKLVGPFDGDIDKLNFSSSGLKLDVDGKQGATTIKGNLSMATVLNLQSMQGEFKKIQANFALPNPTGGSLNLNANADASLNLTKEILLANVDAKLDQSKIIAKLGMNSFKTPAYNFDVNIDQIDLDRYSKKTATAAQNTAAQNKGAATPAEQAIDLSSLKGLNANGVIKIGSLKAAGIKASNLMFKIHAANDKVNVSSIKANLYEGKLDGSMSLTATTPPKFAAKQNLSNVSLAPLLKDVMGKEPIEGHGDVQFDIASQGAVVSAIKKNLNGTAKLNLRDGAVKGINIAKTIRSAKTKLGSGGNNNQGGTSVGDEKTDFSEVSANLNIRNGVAHNEDLLGKSPLFRVGGRGDIDIANERLDYTVKATVVSTLQGQGGPELQALKGLTIPVHLSGPMTNIAWKVDFAGIAQEAAKQKVEEKKQELTDKAKDRLQDKLKGLFNR